MVNQLSQYQATQREMEVAVMGFFEQQETAQLSWENVQLEFAGLKSGWDFRLSKLRSLKNRFSDFDVIHLHGFNPLIAWAAIRSKRKLIYTEHGTFQKANLKLNVSTYLRKRILGFYFLNHHVDQVVFISRWLQQNLGLATRRQRVISNGVTLQVHPIELNSGKFKVLVAARLVVRKRIDRVISAATLMEDQNNVKFEIVGTGPLAAELKAEAQQKKLDHMIQFRGFQSDMNAQYQQCDVVVLPTQYEPFGLVAVEAMLHGKPVICYADGGGAVEVIEGIHPKLIVKNDQELADALAYWQNHPEQAKSVGNQLRERALSKYTLSQMSDAYVELYHELVEQSSKAS